jgi:uncharacterized protein YcbK (DUF882 family)
MSKISPHFNRKEFACKCGCGFDTVDIETIELIEDIRKWIGEPVIITSGCRCAAHNRTVGGSPKSQHKKARAADLSVSDPVKVYNYLCTKYAAKYGFGLYKTFVHVDTRTNGPARWGA